MFARAALVAGLVTGAYAGAAAAEPAPIPVGSAAGEPFGVALAGRSAVWPTATGIYAPPEVHAASPSRAQRTILRAEQPDPGVERLPLLDAGPRLVAVSLVDFVRTERTVRVVGASLWAGRPYGPLRGLGILRPREWTPAVAVNGARLAVLAADRTDESGPLRLLVHDTRSGQTQRRRLSRNVRPALAFSGRFVATISQRGDRDLTRVTVRAIRSWRPISHVRVREDAIDVAIALRSDGTLAVAYGHPRFRAALVAPGSRRTNLRGRPSSLAIGFGRRGVVYSERARRGTRLVEVRPSGSTGPLTAPVRGFVGFDSDREGRVAVRTRRCVYIAAAPALDAAPDCSGEA